MIQDMEELNMIQNPYLDEFIACEGSNLYRRLDHRDKLVTKYAWAVPSAEAIETLVKHSPLVEIGAGTGYWANLILRAGGYIWSYDIKPPAQTHVIVRDGDECKVIDHPDCTLFLCWPPYATPMAANALSLYEGNKFIYVGEYGGCTGDDEFHNILKDSWEREKIVDLPQWGGVHDALYVFQRKS